MMSQAVQGAEILAVAVPDNPPSGRYSQAVISDSACLGHIAGQVAVRDGQVLCVGDASGQARIAFDNLDLTLRELNAQWSNVCSLRMYVVGQENFQAVGDVYREWAIDWAPASTLVFVQALFRPEVLVEVEAVVALDRRLGAAAVPSSDI
jgi:enamine deaminase RidA (YjgF/YER057c/UK114 family)